MFGRNASAGLINIISKRPSYRPAAYGEATIGNYDYRRLAGGVTGGFSDTLAGRLDRDCVCAEVVSLFSQ